VVNVANGADVHVRLGPFKLAFCHDARSSVLRLSFKRRTRTRNARI
jgi:hypothetical protein